MTKMINRQSFENNSVEVTLHGETRRVRAFMTSSGAILTGKGVLCANHAGSVRGAILGQLADGRERAKVDGVSSRPVRLFFA